MKRLIFILLLMALLIPVSAKAESNTMEKVYLLPVVQVGNARYAKYFASPVNHVSGIICNRDVMYYGFVNAALLVAHDITQADRDALILNGDVYEFPDNLDQPITDGAVISVFFEALNIPTDWLTPSNTYRELIRQTAGMMQFNQAYAGIAAAADGLPHSIFDNGRTLESNFNTLSTTEKAWFNAAIQKMQPGAPSVQGNPKLRSLAKQAGNLWGNRSFLFGGRVF